MLSVTGSNRRPVIAGIVLALTIILILGIYTTWRTHNRSTDFRTYYFAASRVSNSLPLYIEQDIPQKGFGPYIYPPFFACLLAPFSLLSLEIASFIWYMINVALFAISIYLCHILIFGDNNTQGAWGQSGAILKILLLAVSAALFLDNISLLQSNILLLFAILAGLYLFKKGKDIAAAPFFAAAISIKIIPIPFLLYFIIKKRFSMSFFIIFFVIVFTLVFPLLYMSPANTLQALEIWSKNTLMRSISFVPNFQNMDRAFHPGNQSIMAFISRWSIGNDEDISWWKSAGYKYPRFMIEWNPSLSRASGLLLSKMAALALLAVTFIAVILRKKEQEREALNYEFALMFMASIIASPIVNTQHLILLMFPLFFTLASLRQSQLSHQPAYWAIVLFSILYLSLGIKIFKIFGFGALAVLTLWAAIISQYIGFLKDPQPDRRGAAV